MPVVAAEVTALGHQLQKLVEVMAEVEPVQIVVGTLVLLEPPTLAVEAVEQVLLTTEHLVPVDQV